MFNLDQTISEWRRQMLAAGIKTPVPQEELEIHLREEIDEQIRSGLTEAEAFQAAVNKLGQAHLLQTEFKKVKTNRIMIRSILLIIGWLAASFTLTYGVAGWDCNWNLFHFSPRWNLGVMVELSGVLVALVAMWFLAKASRDKTSRGVSLLICVFLAAGSVLFFPSEKISVPQPVPALSPQMTSDQAMHYIMKIRIDRAISSIFSRSVPSPLWFRGGRTLLLSLPGIFWVWLTFSRLVQNRSPTAGSRAIHSD